MDEKMIEKIEDYINGTMSSEEKLRFETELATNNELASDFRLYQAIEAEMRGNIKHSGEEKALLSSLEALTRKHFSIEQQKGEAGAEAHQQPAAFPKADEAPKTRMTKAVINDKKQNTVRSLSIWKRLAVAAVLLGAAIMGAIWLVQSGGKTPKETVGAGKTNTLKKTAEPDTTSPVLNSSANDVANSDKNEKPLVPNNETTTVRLTPRPIDSERLNALYTKFFKPDALPQPDQNAPDFNGNEHYEKGEYKEAITSFNDVIARLENPDLRTRGGEDERSVYLFYAYYYRAQSYTAVDSIAKAISDLRQALKNSPDDYLKSKVQWYLALTYLKKGQPQEAEALLKQVAKNANVGEYKQKANQLLGELIKAAKNN